MSIEQMSPDSVVAYLSSSKNQSNPQKLSERLSDALRKFQVGDVDLQYLEDRLNEHKKNELALLKFQSLTATKPELSKLMAQLFVNLDVRHRAYDYGKYLQAIIKDHNDSDALRSDWESVGEDLSYAWVKILVDNRVSRQSSESLMAHKKIIKLLESHLADTGKDKELDKSVGTHQIKDERTYE